LSSDTPRRHTSRSTVHQPETELLERRVRWSGTDGLVAAARSPASGDWSASFDQLWQALNQRHGRSEGTRQMIELLELGTGHGWDRLRVAVEQTLSMGCHDGAAIRHLLTAEQLNRPVIAAIEIGALAATKGRCR
jgi:hypothetical protein